MSWIVLGEEKNRIQLVSTKDESGLLPRGSYLTIDKGETKFILRVDESTQNEPFSPSPMIIDMDLSGIIQDQKCQNVICACRIKDISIRNDGKIDFIPPQSIARRSTQEEIDLALGNKEVGAKVFLATVHAGNNQILIDDNNNLITAVLPNDMFFHQMLICGKTGSGKTVATKYLAQHFVEDLEGAVLAINVKDVDFLKMNRKTDSKNSQVKKEWEVLGEAPHGISNYVVYYPANTSIDSYQGVDRDYFKKITLSVHDIEPEALSGLLQGISDVGAQNLPNIFRYWQTKIKKDSHSFNDFLIHFNDCADDHRKFPSLNERGDQIDIPIHPSTCNNIQRALGSARDYFDNEDATVLNESHILVKGQMSVINVGIGRMEFGSIMLRHLLHKIVEKNSKSEEKIPILIIIDEVHNFYNSNAGQDALGDLDTICRQGRSQKIGVIFSSQNPSDIPAGLNSVINTKLFFSSDSSVLKSNISGISYDEFENLHAGFAVGNIYGLSKLKLMKFPLSYAGVFE